MLVLSWVYLFVLAAASWIFGSWSFAWAVVAGGVISIVSFWGSQRDVMAFLDSIAPDQGDEAEKGNIRKSKDGKLFAPDVPGLGVTPDYDSLGEPVAVFSR